MGRLEDIIERNRNPKRNRERLTVSIVMGLFVLLILVLMVFTDLGARPAPTVPPRVPHADHIYLGSPHHLAK